MPFEPPEDIFRDSIFRFVSAIGENAVTKLLACNDFSHLQLSGPVRSSVRSRSFRLGAKAVYSKVPVAVAAINPRLMTTTPSR